MSSLTRTTLAASVLAAVRGKMKTNRMEDEKPEAEDDVVGDGQETDPDAEGQDDEPDAGGGDKEPAAEDNPTDPGAETEDDETKPSASSVRRAEQSRIKSILMHPMADASPALAAELAFGTKAYSAKEAGALLTSAAAGGGRLADRMQGRSPKLGSGGPVEQTTEKQSVLANMGAAIKAMHGRNGKGA